MASCLRLALVLSLSLSLVLGPRPAGALTYEEERRLRDEFFKIIQKQMEIIDDPGVTAYVGGLGRRIMSAVGPQPFEYRFFVLKNDVPNAFAAPAGYVFVNSGLIVSLKNEGQLAAILAHEVAHVTSRHLSERLAKAQNLTWATLGGVLAGIFLGGPVGQAVMTGSMAGNIQMQLKYSREDEREADEKGLDYLVQAGYDPRFMLGAFETLLKHQWHAPKDVPTYLMTHPGLDTRMAFVERAVTTHPGYGDVRGRGDERAFRAAQVRLLAVYADPLRAVNHFEQLIKTGQDPGLGHYGLGLLYQAQQKYDSAAGEFKEALKVQPANPDILTDLGILLFKQGDFPGALEYLGRAAVLRPESVPTTFYLARIYQEQGQEERAKELYLNVVRQDPGHAQALYNLGLIYGRAGDLARAHLHTGLSFKASGKPEQALFHLRKAREMAGPGSSALRDRIEKALQEVEKEVRPGPPPGGGR